MYYFRSIARVFLIPLALPALCCLLGMPAAADVKLPAVIGDNMVLQRAISVPVWGWADPGEKVTVSFATQTKTTTADAKTGRWMVRLDSMKEDGPLKMTVAGKNRITLKNILVGEVWVCSGQSNMGFPLRGANDSEKEISQADYPRLRLFSVPLLGTQTPLDDCQGQWVECNPETAPNFSAVGYFFGREIHQKLNIPVGLINTSWGGSSCEAWIDRSVLEADARYQSMLAEWDRNCADYDPEKVKAAYEKKLETWKRKVQEAKDSGKKAPRRPRAPSDPRNGQHRPANLYNGMITPILPYAIRGAIWYQGESNASRAYQYRHLFPTMISGWRTAWQQGDFPFYFVQLANFMATKPEPGDSAWAELREAQSMTLSFPHTGQAVIIDIGEAGNIHPKDKQDVGKRLALWALAKDYGKSLVYAGPTYQSMSIQGNKVVLSFDHTGSGLVAKGGGPLAGFAVAGADKKFVWAEAKIVGHTVQVSSPEVAAPVAVRYAWADNPVCNLYNQEGLPGCPFRTDQWPGVTAQSE